MKKTAETGGALAEIQTENLKADGKSNTISANTLSSFLFHLFTGNFSNF
jgi:hypothetical protein